jgi:hypothetical protein
MQIHHKLQSLELKYSTILSEIGNRYILFLLLILSRLNSSGVILFYWFSD